MTRDEALNLKTFKHYCTCGGFAWTMNGRDPEHCHKAWCPQFDEYKEWWDALHSEPVADSEGEKKWKSE